MSVIQFAIDKLSPIFQATDEVLTAWTGDGNLQFPTLMANLSIKMNWSEKELREADPFVRFYVRHHPDWHVTRGAHGGIMKSSDKQKKEATKLAKIVAKQAIKAALEKGEKPSLTSLAVASALNDDSLDELPESSDE